MTFLRDLLGPAVFKAFALHYLLGERLALLLSVRQHENLVVGQFRKA